MGLLGLVGEGVTGKLNYTSNLKLVLKFLIDLYRRGPNKYTRNWEDEEAYNKPPLKKNIPPRKPRNKSEDSGQSSKSQDQKYESKESNSNNNQIEDYQDQ